jgi:OPA family glycerol-3-phosphate transporter-like MFS transporter
MQWYFIFAKEIKQPGAEYFLTHWGFLLFVTGVIASFAGGFISDNLFHSRRGPPAAIFYVMTLFFLVVMAFTLKTSPVVVGICALVVCMSSIGVHALMSGTAAADFGGRKATATAAGITDGFVYLGGAIQSVCLGHLTTLDWAWWPIFLIPFAAIGLYLTLRMWSALPNATKNYLSSVEKVDIHAKKKSRSKVGVSLEARS